MKKLITFAAALLYFLLPFDLIPDVLLGWGWIDDLIILGLVLRYLLTGNVPSFLNRKPFQTRQDSTHQKTNDREKTNRPSENIYSGLTPHEILGVAPTASEDEIRTAYRKLVNQYHPDKVHHLGAEFQELAEVKFKTIQNAYQKLVHHK